jgi:hypothetical protein
MNILVPPDIVPVKRLSPIKAKTRTPWREKPEGEPIERGRQWIADQVLVPESRASQLLDIVTVPWPVHVVAAIALVAIAVTVVATLAA